VIDLAKLPAQFSRRDALQSVGSTLALAAVSGAADPTSGALAETPSSTATDRAKSGFWPNGARLAVSLSLMFEGGGQPISGASGVIPDPIEKGVPDLPTNAFFAYGHYEGIPRLLDIMDKHSIKLSSFMIGRAVETSPDLAQEIVRRGHEAAAHGRAQHAPCFVKLFDDLGRENVQPPRGELGVRGEALQRRAVDALKLPLAAYFKR